MPDATIPGGAQSLVVYLFLPPYRNPVRLGTRAIDGPVPPGTFLALRPSAATPWHEIRQTAELLERRFPAAEMVLWTDLMTREESEPLVSRARAVGIRGATRAPVRSVDSLGRQLSDPVAFGDELVRWLRAGSFPLDAEAADTIRRMAGNPDGKRTLTGLLGSSARARSIQRRFRKHGLGEPGRWFTILRFVHDAVLPLQADREETIARLAERLGFSDDAALRRKCRDIAGVPATTIRELVGWKWCLDRALRRARLLQPEAGTRWRSTGIRADAGEHPRDRYDMRQT